MLETFVEETHDIVDVPQDCENYLCPFCRNTGNKEFAMEWRSNIFVCKTCFQDMNGDDLEEL